MEQEPIGLPRSKNKQSRCTVESAPAPRYLLALEKFLQELQAGAHHQPTMAAGTPEMVSP